MLSLLLMSYLCAASLDSNYIILKKTDMESVFNLFQNCEENKTLVYVSISRFSFYLFNLFKAFESWTLSFVPDAPVIPVEGIISR